jgi:hypothetical protein
MLELGLFAAGVAALIDGDASRLGVAFAVVALAHYVASYDRLGWLLRQ